LATSAELGMHDFPGLWAPCLQKTEFGLSFAQCGGARRGYVASHQFETRVAACGMGRLAILVAGVPYCPSTGAVSVCLTSGFQGRSTGR
jgi:hypothetical protein